MFFDPLRNELREIADRDYLVPLEDRPRTGPNSSFVPGTQLQVVYDSVSIKLLQGCLRRYNFKMVQGWSEQETPPALAFGRDLHTCLETYHKVRALGLDFDIAMLHVVRLAALLGDNLRSTDTSRSKETLVRSVVWYLDQYKDDPLRTAMLPNGLPAVELSFMLPVFDIEVGPTDELPELYFPDVVDYFKESAVEPSAAIGSAMDAVDQGRRLFGKITGLEHYPDWIESVVRSAFYTITVHFSGHIDRVAHFGDEVYITDYKSSKYQLTLDWIRGFDLSTQFEGYFTAATIMASQPNSVFPDAPAGVMVDALQLGVNFTRFARFPLRYTPTTADQFLANLEALARVKAEGAARLGLWPREAESECNAYRRADGSGGCEFIPVCTSAPAAWDRELQRRFTKSIWDPSRSR